MIVAPMYPGDNMALAKLQHDVYWDALRVIVNRCNRYAQIALAITGEDGRHPLWKGVDRFDHRPLQFAHDLLAAAWRFEVSSPQKSLPFPIDDHDTARELEPKTPEGRWLQWLDQEVASWFDAEVGPWDDGPTQIHLVLQILANQNQPVGYEAERGLARIIYKRFSDVPWDEVSNADD